MPLKCVPHPGLQYINLKSDFAGIKLILRLLAISNLNMASKVRNLSWYRLPSCLSRPCTGGGSYRPVNVVTAKEKLTDSRRAFLFFFFSFLFLFFSFLFFLLFSRMLSIFTFISLLPLYKYLFNFFLGEQFCYLFLNTLYIITL